MKPLKLLSLALAVALPATLFAAKDKAQAKAEQAAKNREREVKKAAKDASQYEKLKEYALNLYENDVEFRDQVDKDYEELLRLHSETAYRTNLTRASFVVPIHEDRFRQHVSLYDNLMIQDYVNRLGQKLVPADSEKLFTFRLTAHPIPAAQTLATGTIYISTGLVGMLDNEAQLAYVLAHEMAHVYKDHWKLQSVLRLGETRYNQRQTTKSAIMGLVGAGIGAAIGGAAGRSGSAAQTGALIGGLGGFVAGSLLNRHLHGDWDKVQEDEADQIALKAVLDASYDVREVPKLYATLQNSGRRDSRVTLGFMGNRKRVTERIENTRDLLEKAFKAEVELKQSQGKLIGDNPEFRHLMAELKRDNGIYAYYYDMFEVARANLAEAVAVRSNDPAAQYYYGKVLKQVGRTPEERKLADQSFALSARYDVRGQNFGAHLHRALALMEDKTEANKKVILEELQSYVTTYLTFAVNNARGRNLLPPNLDTIYEYMSVLGENSWAPALPNDAPMFLEANQVRAEPTQPAVLDRPAAAEAAPQPAAPEPAKKSRLPLPIPRKK